MFQLGSDHAFNQLLSESVDANVSYVEDESLMSTWYSFDETIVLDLTRVTRFLKKLSNCINHTQNLSVSKSFQKLGIRKIVSYY